MNSILNLLQQSQNILNLQYLFSNKHIPREIERYIYDMVVYKFKDIPRFMNTLGKTEKDLLRTPFYDNICKYNLYDNSFYLYDVIDPYYIFGSFHNYIYSMKDFNKIKFSEGFTHRIPDKQCVSNSLIFYNSKKITEVIVIDQYIYRVTIDDLTTMNSENPFVTHRYIYEFNQSGFVTYFTFINYDEYVTTEEYFYGNNEVIEMKNHGYFHSFEKSVKNKKTIGCKSEHYSIILPKILLSILKKIIS